MTIQWIKQAWNDVTSETVINCFKHSPEDDIDPFSDLDCVQELVTEIDLN